MASKEQTLQQLADQLNLYRAGQLDQLQGAPSLEAYQKKFGRSMPYTEAQPHFTPRQAPSVGSMGNRIMSRVAPLALIYQGLEQPVADATLAQQYRNLTPFEQEYITQQYLRR